LNLYNFQASVF